MLVNHLGAPTRISARVVRIGAVIGLPALLIAMFVCQIIIFPNPPRGERDGAFVVMALLAIIVGFAVFRYCPLPGAPTVPHALMDARTVPHLRFPWIILAAVCSLYVTWRTTYSFAGVPAGEYLIIWSIAIVSLVLAAVKPEGSGGEEAVRVTPEKGRLLPLEIGLLIVLFAVALFIRMYKIEEIPHVLDQDEARFALNGVGMRQMNYADSPFKPGIHSHPQLNYVLVGLSTGWFGETLVGARFFSVLFGALGVPAIYLLGRELIDWRYGLIAALFAMTWAFHIIFSRLALNQASDALFATLPFYFLLRGLRRGRALDFVLCGITLGIAQLFYAGGRIAPLILVAYLVWLFIRERQPIRPRLIGVLGLSFAIVALPQHYYLLVNRLPLTDRAAPNVFIGGDFQKKVTDKGGSALDYFALAADYSFLGLFTRADNGGWYGGGSNLLGPFGGPPFLVGAIVVTLVIWRKARRSPQAEDESQPIWPTTAPLALPLGWTLATIVLLSTLATFPPQYQRYFPASAPIAILVSVGVVAFIDAVIALLGAGQWHSVAVVGAALLFGAANLGFFVDYYIPARQYVANRANYATNAVAHAMAEQADAGRQVVLISGFMTGIENTGVVKYYMVGRAYFAHEDDKPLEVPVDFIQQLDVTKPFAIFIPPTRPYDLDFLKQNIPGGTAETVTLVEDGSVAYYLYRTYLGLPPPPPETIPGN